MRSQNSESSFPGHVSIQILIFLTECVWQNTYILSCASRALLAISSILCLMFSKMPFSSCAASNTQKCSWRSDWGNHRTHYMYICGSDRWKHVGIKDFSAYCCNGRRIAFPWIFFIFILLSPTMIMEIL